MPKCRECGNCYSFGCSQAPPSAPTANGPLSSVIGEFDEQHEMMSMNSWGASKNLLRHAVISPQQFFDVCSKCGSHSIDWGS